MLVEGPPLSIRLKEEKKLFSTFIRNLKKVPTSKDFHMLSKQYLAATDYRNIFPKIPSVLKSYYNKWKSNQDLKTLLAAHREPYYKLLRWLSKPVDPQNLDVAASFQKKSSDKNRREIEQNQKTKFKNITKNNPHNPLPVAPSNAPSATRYVRGTGEMSKKDYPCSGAIFGCVLLGKHCSGYNKPYTE